jgi:hypothetical protein
LFRKAVSLSKNVGCVCALCKYVRDSIGGVMWIKGAGRCEWYVCTCAPCNHFYRCPWLSLYLYTCECLCVCISKCACVSEHLFISQYVCLSVYLSVSLSVFKSVCLYHNECVTWSVCWTAQPPLRVPLSPSFLLQASHAHSFPVVS